MLPNSLQKNDQRAHWIIWIFSAIVFVAVTVLDRIALRVDLGFDPHIFAQLSAAVNSVVAVLLLLGLWLVKQGKWAAHKKVMLGAMTLSVLFLLFYIAHHLFTGETRFGDFNHDGILNAEEQEAAGILRYVYYILIGTHIALAAGVMPFVLYSAYRALTGDYARHKKLVRYTFPIWLYVAVTGVLVYFMISPYYA